MHSVLLDWIKSYLKEREQYVKIGEWQSKIFRVKSGVPQGSHLGPFLFTVFINDIVKNVKHSKCLMYADDLKLFSPVKSIYDASCVQRDLDEVFKWCQLNKLFLNIDKCKCVTYHRKRSPLYFDYRINHISLIRVNEMRDLGVLYNEKIDFIKHIDLTISKAYAMLGFVMRICSEFNDPSVLKVLYFSYVRSIVEYALVVWQPSYNVHIDRLESIQKKFLKFVFCKFGYYRYIEYAPYEFKCKLMNIESLANRRRKISIFFMYDIISGHFDAPELLSLIDINVPPRALRNNNLIHIRHHRTNYGR
jgi:Reverse transcriptase (RNA-dependent DNA polymerase)